MTQALTTFGTADDVFAQATTPSVQSDKAPEIKIIQKGSTFISEDEAFDNKGKFYITDTKEILDKITGVILYRFENYSAYDNDNEVAYYTNDIFKNADGDLPIFIFRKSKDGDQEIVEACDRKRASAFMKEVNGKTGYKNHLGIYLNDKLYRLYLTGGSTDNLFKFINENGDQFFTYNTEFTTEYVDSGSIKFYAAKLQNVGKTKKDHLKQAREAITGIQAYWAEKVSQLYEQSEESAGPDVEAVTEIFSGEAEEN